MFVEAYGSAVIMLAASVLVGEAVCTLCGGTQRWSAAPLVGLGSLIIVARVGVQLPGEGAVAEVGCIASVVAAAGYLMWRRIRPLGLAQIGVAAAALLIASLPFVASGRIGVPAGLDNDMAVHLLVTEGLRSSRMAHLWGVVNGSLLPPYAGYPLGGNSVAAALGNLTGIRLDLVFTGLLLAITALTAVVGMGVLEGQATWRRIVIGLMCAFAYLVSAYYAQAAFKETLMAGLLLAFVLHLEQVQIRWHAAGNVTRWALAVPAVILVGAAIYDYSYLGITWFAATLALWALAEAIRRPSVAFAWLSREHMKGAAPWVGGTIGLAILLLLPEAGQALAFFSRYGVSATGVVATSNLGNLLHALSPYESLGIWFSPDFRVAPADAFQAGELGLFALALFVYGFVWAVRRRRFVLTAAAGGGVLIWWYASQTQSAYIAAKGLVIASPVFIALVLSPLLSRDGSRVSRRILSLAVAVTFCLAAAYSSVLALRNEPIQAPEAGRELARFEKTIGDSRVLFLGADDFAPWELRSAYVTSLTPPTLTQAGAATRTNKPFVPGDPLDFDSVDPNDLDNFSYVVTSNSDYASQAPPNFRLVASGRLYDLWERTGPTAFRLVLEQSNAPGALLNCHVPTLREARGEAALMTQPLVLPGVTVPPGRSRTVSFGVPRGEWQVSIQYLSDYPVQLRAGTRRWTMPAYVGRAGPYFRVGVVLGQGISKQIKLVIDDPRPSFLSGSNQVANITGIAAVRLPDTRRIVPLQQACGRYVDWFTVS